MKKLIDNISDKLVNAFLQNKIIAPIPSKFTKKLEEAQKLRVLCESKIKYPVIGLVLQHFKSVPNTFFICQL